MRKLGNLSFVVGWLCMLMMLFVTFCSCRQKAPIGKESADEASFRSDLLTLADKEARILRRVSRQLKSENWDLPVQRALKARIILYKGDALIEDFLSQHDIMADRTEKDRCNMEKPRTLSSLLLGKRLTKDDFQENTNKAFEMVFDSINNGNRPLTTIEHIVESEALTRSEKLTLSMLLVIQDKMKSP